MRDYGLKREHPDEWVYESERHQHKTDTATVWCLHIKVETIEEVPIFLHNIKVVGEKSWAPPLTGHYVVTDWEVPGEPPGTRSVDLVIYYNAAPQFAEAAGALIAGYIGADFGSYSITTSGDWAEKLERTFQ